MSLGRIIPVAAELGRAAEVGALVHAVTAPWVRQVGDASSGAV